VIAVRRSCVVLGLVLLAVPARADEPEVFGARVVAFSPDGKLLAVGTGLREQPGQLTVWDVVTRKVRWTHREPKGVAAAVFAPDGKTVAIGYFDKVAKLLSAADGTELRAFGEHDKEVRAVAFSPDGATLATGSYDFTVKLWDAAKGGPARATLKGHTDMIYAVAFAPDGKSLVSAGGDGTRLWDPATGAETRQFKSGGFLSRCVVFTPDSKWLIAGDWGGSVRVWNVESGAERMRLGGRGGVDGIAFSPETGVLAVCGFASTIGVYGLTLRDPDAKEQEKIRKLLARLDADDYDEREAASKEVLALGLVAEAELRKAAQESASAEVRIRARLLRRELLTRPQVLSGHGGAVECLTFSPDGKLLASASKDGTAKLWDVARRKEVATFTPPQPEQPR
jgi:WD40 repeat protein